MSKSPVGPQLTLEEEALLAAFKVFGEPVRIRILSAVTAAPDGICIADMVPVVGVTQPTVSHHVATLAEAGLVTVEKVGIRKIVRINKGGFERVVDLFKSFLPAAFAGE